MIAEYITSNTEKIQTESIKGKAIHYEMSKDDLLTLVHYRDSLILEGKTPRIFLTKDHKNYHMLTDNIDSGYIWQGGPTKDNKYFISQFVIKKGLDEFLETLK